MTSFRQIEANRRNALKSTGPITEEGKRRSAQNAVRHGLTAETTIVALEDSDDYKAFELAVTADYRGETAVERELVLRLASLLWWLRRATAIETGLFEMQAEISTGQRRLCQTEPKEGSLATDSAAGSSKNLQFRDNERHDCPDGLPTATLMLDLARCFIDLSQLDHALFERLGRYETALWRQTRQVMFSLAILQNACNTVRRSQALSVRKWSRMPPFIE